MYHSYESMSNADALSKYEARLALLDPTCECTRCSPPHINTETDELPPPMRRQCLVIIMETMINLCGLLARIDLAVPLLPTLRGMQLLYRTAHDKCAFERMDKSPLGRFRFVCSQSLFDHVRAATLLFSGHWEENIPERFRAVSAVSVQGICVYIDCLREPSDDAQLLSRLHVIPGQIESESKPYQYVQDWIWYEDRPEEAELLNSVQSSNFMDAVKTRVRERPESLAIRYEIFDNQEISRGLSFRPIEMTEAVLSSNCQIICPPGHRSQDATIRDTISDRLVAVQWPIWHTQSVCSYVVMRASAVV